MRCRRTPTSLRSTPMPISTTFSRTCRPSSSKGHGGRGILLLVLAATVTLGAQSINPSLLLNPTKDTWPTYHGDYSGRRHSALTQITPGNVKQLGLQWVFQTGRTEQLKASPILVNGVIYLTAPD